MKSLLLLALATLAAFNSYSNYQTLARSQQRTHTATPEQRAVFYAASYEPVFARPESNALPRELLHGLRLNFSLTIFLLFAVAISTKERMR